MLIQPPERLGPTPETSNPKLSLATSKRVQRDSTAFAASCTTLPLLVASFIRCRPSRKYCRGQPAARGELAAYHAPFRIHRSHDVAQYLVDRILIEDAQISIRQQIHLQRL